MAKILKPYEVPLDADLAQEILRIPVDSGFGADSVKTIGDRVTAAVNAVKEANEYLAGSKLAAIVADTLMRQLKKRGNPQIMVRPDGTVILRVSYAEEVKARKPKPAVRRASKKSDLPPITELRRQAEELGIDISDLGKKRRAIFERIQGAAEAAAEDAEVNPPHRLVDEQQEGDDLPIQEPPRLRKRSSPTVQGEVLDVEALLSDGA